MQDEWIQELSRQCEFLFRESKGSHDWEHTLRVCRLCRKIGIAEGADMQVLYSAALLHDIGRCHQDQSAGAVCHAEKGAQMAVDLIQPLPLTPIQKDNILHCVRTHRYRGANRPETLEACVLFDADKLDAIGAIGVARAYLFAGEVGARLHNPDNNISDTRPYSREDTGYREFMVKLRKIRDRIITGEGRKIAADRHAYMVSFFERFIAEHDGIR